MQSAQCAKHDVAQLSGSLRLARIRIATESRHRGFRGQGFRAFATPLTLATVSFLQNPSLAGHCHRSGTAGTAPMCSPLQKKAVLLPLPTARSRCQRVGSRSLQGKGVVTSPRFGVNVPISPDRVNSKKPCRASVDFATARMNCSGG